MALKHLYSLIVLAAVACVAVASFVWRSDLETFLFRADAAPASVKSGVRAAPVVLATAASATFPIKRTANGFLSSPAVAAVNARIQSQVTKVAVKDGQTVKAGDLLFSLDDKVLQAQLAKDKAALAKDQAALLSAQGDLKRAKDLADKGVGTQQAYDEQTATTNGLVATLAADQASIEADMVQLGFVTITAPIAGRLGEVNTSVGDLVGGSRGGAAGTTPTAMVTITQFDPLQVTFNLPEADLSLLQKGLSGTSPAEVTLRRPSDSTVVATGMLDFIDTSVDATSGTIAARAAIPNPGNTLWPGLYVDVTVSFGTLDGAVSVPTVAVQQGQDGAFVFVVDEAGKATIRKVDVTLTDKGNSAIAQGLKVGENVVVEGQGRLKDGASVRAVSAGDPKALVATQ